MIFTASKIKLKRNRGMPLSLWSETALVGSVTKSCGTTGRRKAHPRNLFKGNHFLVDEKIKNEKMKNRQEHLMGVRMMFLMMMMMMENCSILSDVSFAVRF